MVYTKPGSDEPEVTGPTRMEQDLAGHGSRGTYSELEARLHQARPGPREVEEEGGEPDHTVITEERVDHDAVDNMASVANNQTEAATGMSLTMMVLIGVVVLAAMYFLTRKGGSPTPPPSQGGGGGGGVQGTIGPQGASMQGGGMNAQFSR